MTEELIPQNYLIDTEISQEYQDEVLDFIQQNYLKARPEYFTNIKKSRNNGINQLSFISRDPKNDFKVEIIIKAG